ncbi:MAG TPA: DUF2169 domain-containing protein [Polyangiales bacterium]
MLQLKNETPFQAAIALFPNAKGVDSAYLVVTATFALEPTPAVAQEQLAPTRSDVYFEEPGSSSLRFPAELHLGKPSTDVIVVGHARSPGGKPVPELGVGVEVAERKKVARVLGDRVWTGMSLTRPAPFTEIPLIYERAFGGVLALDNGTSLSEERNPLGKGLSYARGAPRRGDPMPNLEDPRQPVVPGVRPAPVGFGAVLPAWLPRRTYAGTYDETWQQTRAPYLPDDFQPRYFNCAADGLTFDRYFRGGEPITLMGMSERGPLTSRVPTVQLRTTFVIAGQKHERPNHLQTVLLEPDQQRMRLTFHAEIECDKRALQVEAVEVALASLTMEKAS